MEQKFDRQTYLKTLIKFKQSDDKTKESISKTLEFNYKNISKKISSNDINSIVIGAYIDENVELSFLIQCKETEYNFAIEIINKLLEFTFPKAYGEYSNTLKMVFPFEIDNDIANKINTRLKSIWSTNNEN